MKAQKHPEYATEATKLHHVLQVIDAQLAEYKQPIEATGADQRAARELLKLKLENMNLYREASQKPYSGRVDWLPEDKNTAETFYIGIHAIPELGIYSWQGTLPADVYYQGSSTKEVGTRLLKRALVTCDRVLTDIIDEAVDRRRADVMGPEVRRVTAAESAEGGDHLLLDLLQGPRGDQLREIVATIQEEQYRIISAPLEQVLVIQGVPGSGKTIIALHRISYLLYQNRTLGNRLRVQFFGPNPIFLRHIERVLPDLGDRGIPQTAFDTWMIKTVGLEDKFEPEEEGLEYILEPGTSHARKVMRYRNAHNKGSIAMSLLLEKYVDHLSQEVVSTLGDISISIPRFRGRTGERVDAFSLTLHESDVTSIVLKAKFGRMGQESFNTWKERALAGLVAAAIASARSRSTKDSDDAREFENFIRDKAQRGIPAELSQWKAENLVVSYRRLLRSPSLLHQLGADLFTQWDLEMMHFDAPKQGTPFRFSDLGALLFLKAMLDGVDPSEQFDLVVVDEAQDMSPLQFLALRRWSRNGAFTILGDISQGIYSDLGLNTWNDLNGAFEGLNKWSLRQSYRSTQQIVEYANRLAAATGSPEDEVAIPLARTGDEVSEEEFLSSEDRAARIARRVQSMRQRSDRTIAILAKTSASCRSIAEEFHATGFFDFVLIDDKNQIANAPVLLMPTYLSKGLEFDFVIIADADAETYKTTVLDARLLYVALTRAASDLAVGWIGTRSQLLDPDRNLEGNESESRFLLAEQLATIEEIAGVSPGVSETDAIVERLAGAGKLHLLKDGTFDSPLLELLSENWPSHSPDSESLAELPNSVRQTIAELVRDLEAEESPATHDGLAFLQLVAGLLRNTLAGWGITLPDIGTLECSDQAVALLTFWNDTVQNRKAFAQGAYTTERRSLGAVHSTRYALAQEYLALLHVSGVIESTGLGRSERIRIENTWIPIMVATALGDADPALDDALARRLPSLPLNLCELVNDRASSHGVQR